VRLLTWCGLADGSLALPLDPVIDFLQVPSDHASGDRKTLWEFTALFHLEYCTVTHRDLAQELAAIDDDTSGNFHILFSEGTRFHGVLDMSGIPSIVERMYGVRRALYELVKMCIKRVCETFSNMLMRVQSNTVRRCPVASNSVWNSSM
jgi:hypothetical protein